MENSSLPETLRAFHILDKLGKVERAFSKGEYLRLLYVGLKCFHSDNKGKETKYSI